MTIYQLNDDEILELAKSIQQGRPTPGCPIPFSYVAAARVFAEYIVANEVHLRTTGVHTSKRDA